MSDSSLWMVPLANLLLFSSLGLLLYLINRRWPHSRTWKSSVWLLASLALFGVIILWEGLHPVAVALLSAGMATEIVRLAGRHRARFHRLVRSTFGLPVFFSRPRPGVGEAPRESVPDTRPVATRREFLLGAGAVLGTAVVGIAVSRLVSERPQSTKLVKLPASNPMCY